MIDNQIITEHELDYKQMVDLSLNSKLIIDGFNIIYINQTCLNLLKELKHEFVKNGFYTYLHPEYSEICKQKITKILEGDGVELLEIKMIRSDREIIDVEVVCAPFFYNGVTLVQITIRDIRDRIKNERLLIQSEKLSTIGEVAAGIVHEIRNPLTTIKGFLQILQSNDSQDAKYLEIMKSEVLRIEKIANDLLKLAKPEVELFKEENVVEIIEDVFFMWETEAFKKQISVNFICTDKFIPIYCDRSHITQVFINMIKNAIEACKTNGEIYVDISLTSTEILFKIIDNGSGMPQDMIDKLGTSFQTSKKDGTGLGLMVSYNIIKNHRGKVSVDSEEGKGTTFYITLPLSKGII